MKDRRKIQAKLNLAHLDKLHLETGIPLVLHGGSGVQKEYVSKAIKKGIVKINIGTDIRQSYESAYSTSGKLKTAQEAVYKRTKWIIREYFNLTNLKQLLLEE